MTHYDLSAFQRDVLHAIAAVTDAGETPYGLALKRWLDDRYADPINHSRLYQNLDQLATDGLIDRESLDARTNEYTLTDAGRRVLEHRLVTLARVCRDTHAADGGADR